MRAEVSHAEIAKELAISEQAVAQCEKRAFAKLRAIIAANPKSFPLMSEHDGLSFLLAKDSESRKRRQDQQRSFYERSKRK